MTAKLGVAIAIGALVLSCSYAEDSPTEGTVTVTEDSPTEGGVTAAADSPTVTPIDEDEEPPMELLERDRKAREEAK